ncbi:MAG: GtrA family protein [Lewinella sp.]
MMERLFHFVKEKIPFALTGLVATGINFGVYLLLVDRYLPPGPATVIAYSSSVILNFFLQRHFVFELNRSIESAFVLSMLVSAGGLVLDWLIVTGLHTFPYLGDQEWVIKLVATGIVFFYNFYAKRRVFEGSKGEKDEGEQGAGPQVQSEFLKSDEREGITNDQATGEKRGDDN